MLFQLRTDNHIHGSEEMTASVRAEIEGALTDRYATQLRRVEVYLQDANGAKGAVDKRCTIEAQLAGHQPIVVHHHAAHMQQAVSGAADKLLRALEHTLGRLADR